MSDPLETPGRRPGTVIAVLVALVQLTALTWVPVAHAQRTDRGNGPAVEDTHAPDCSEIHVETRCATCVATQAEWPCRRQRFDIEGLSAVHIQCGTTRWAMPTQVHAPSNPARAPPSS